MNTNIILICLDEMIHKFEAVVRNFVGEFIEYELRILC